MTSGDVLMADFIPFEDEGLNNDNNSNNHEKIDDDDDQNTKQNKKNHQHESQEAPRHDDKNAVILEKSKDEANPSKNTPVVTSVLRYNAPWVNHKRKYSTVPIEFLHQELVDFANYVSPTEEERYARAEAIRRLEKVVQNIWPEAQVHAFGSFDSQLFLPTSDLDVVVLNPQWETEAQVNRALAQLARSLVQVGLVEEETLKTITKARIPLIKYKDRQTDFEVDVSFNQESGLQAATFMRDEMARQPAIRPLTLALKCFLDMRALNEVFYGGLGSYSIMCLVISLLQMHPLVQSGLMRAHENLGVLLMELFELYGRNFNSEVVGIDVQKGGRYFRKQDWEWIQAAKPHLLSIADPQDDENDISKGSFAYGSVRQAFDHAFNVLKLAMTEFERAVRTKKLPQGNDQRRSKTHPPIPSILGSIITLNPKVLRHRFFIQQTTNL